MTDTVSAERHYAYPLVTWGSTLLGVAVALITAFMLNLLGAALGIAVAAFGQSADAAQTGGIIGMIWLAVANLIALGFGAWVAGRSTANPDHHGGALQGVAVWAVTSVAVLYLAGSAIAGIGGAAMKTADIAATASSGAVAQQAARSQANSTQTEGQANSALQNVQASAQQNAGAIQDAAVKTAGTTATAAFGAFLAMALGLVAAIVGARIGARHPNWADRPRLTYAERSHDTLAR